MVDVVQKGQPFGVDTPQKIADTRRNCLLSERLQPGQAIHRLFEDRFLWNDIAAEVSCRFGISIERVEGSEAAGSFSVWSFRAFPNDGTRGSSLLNGRLHVRLEGIGRGEIVSPVDRWRVRGKLIHPVFADLNQEECF